ncbi:hypothetical protein M1D49_07915 [Bacillus sp. PK3-056]|uniref:hypothetical protein n=1 Tax=Niallia circulans TaxID=1397 RepID=UPI000F454AE2|nr:hypothetical protein [Niallia circulans]AYV74284.1 hypothetical protein C2H98_23495 [Niallia circulans]
MKKVAALLLVFSIIIGVSSPTVSAEEQQEPSSQEETGQLESGVISPMYIPGGGGGIGGG